jgi:hypothetical protein
MVDPSLAQRVAVRTREQAGGNGCTVHRDRLPTMRADVDGAEASAPGVEVLDLVELLARALEAG